MEQLTSIIYLRIYNCGMQTCCRKKIQNKTAYVDTWLKYKEPPSQLSWIFFSFVNCAWHLLSHALVTFIVEGYEAFISDITKLILTVRICTAYRINGFIITNKGKPQCSKLLPRCWELILRLFDTLLWLHKIFPGRNKLPPCEHSL